MEPGYIPDKNVGAYEPQKWFPGALRLSRLEGVAKNKAGPLYVISYRCPGCGYIESYALKKEVGTV